MNQIHMEQTVSLREAADLVVSCGAGNTFHLVGEPGVGKTSIHRMIAERLNMKAIYIDVPNTELGDLGIPMPDRESKTTALYPSEHWGFHLDEPLCVMLDEFTKGAPAVKNMLHPLLTKPRRIGGLTLHKDSVVLTAGNLTSDGVGDVMAAHSRNRLSVLNIRKPSADEWVEWGMSSIAPVLLAWVKETPHCLATYLDSAQENNHLIYNPRLNQKSFVSPRSLELASNIIKAREGFSQKALMAALQGTIGGTAAGELAAFIDLADSLPSRKDIIETPETAKVPNDPAALCILAFGAVQWVDKHTISKWFTYMQRAPKELQSIFCLTAAKSEDKKKVLFSSQSFIDWARANHYLF